MGRVPLLAALAAAAIAVAGCGGEGGGGGAGADIVPSSAAVFISLNTEFDGDQWQQAEALFERFPAGDDAIGDLLRELESDDLDFETDIKPAVGPEVVIAVLDLQREEFVVLTQPADPEKFRELVASGDDPGVTEEIDGWWAAAESQEVLDRFKAAREDGTIGEEDAFGDAMDDFPEDALARLYLNGEALTGLASTEVPAGGDQETLLNCFTGGESIPGFGLALSAEESGARVEGSARVEGIETPDSGSWDVLEGNVDQSFAFVAARGLGEQIRSTLRCAADADEDFSRQLAQAELVLGVSVEEDLLPLFDDETVFSVDPTSAAGEGGALGVATFSLVSEVEDEDAARATLDKIAARVSAFSDDVTIEDVTVEGAAAKRLTVASEGFSVLFGVYDGRLVITTTEEGIRNVSAGGEANAAYAEALEDAGAPSESASVAWVDVPAVVDFLNTVLAPMGQPVPPDAQENLEPLRSVLFWSEGGEEQRFEGFFEIE